MTENYEGDFMHTEGKDWVSLSFMKHQKKGLIVEFLEDLKRECLGGDLGSCLYSMDSIKCDSECPNYILYEKWEERK